MVLNCRPGHMISTRKLDLAVYRHHEIRDVEKESKKSFVMDEPMDREYSNFTYQISLQGMDNVQSFTRSDRINENDSLHILQKLNPHGEKNLCLRCENDFDKRRAFIGRLGYERIIV